MRFMNIASGSGGNATYVGSDHTHILIDTGVSRKKIKEGLKRLDLSLEDITAVLITHEHTDHICSLGVLERTRQIPVYMTAGTARAIEPAGCLPEERDLLHLIRAEESFQIGDLTIMPLQVSHDASETVCYKVQSGSAGCAVVTDLGIWTDSLRSNLEGLQAVLLEANHDVRMLETGPYPYLLKRRIAGQGGHLSNESCGQLLSALLHPDMRYISLGHLSKKNNTPELANLAVKMEIDTSDTPYHAADFRIDVADPLNGTDIYEF